MSDILPTGENEEEDYDGRNTLDYGTDSRYAAYNPEYQQPYRARVQSDKTVASLLWQDFGAFQTAVSAQQFYVRNDNQYEFDYPSSERN